jgi:hypothetical protein
MYVHGSMWYECRCWICWILHSVCVWERYWESWLVAIRTRISFKRLCVRVQYQPSSPIKYICLSAKYTSCTAHYQQWLLMQYLLLKPFKNSRHQFTRSVIQHEQSSFSDIYIIFPCSSVNRGREKILCFTCLLSPIISCSENGTYHRIVQEHYFFWQLDSCQKK